VVQFKSNSREEFEFKRTNLCQEYFQLLLKTFQAYE